MNNLAPILAAYFSITLSWWAIVAIVCVVVAVIYLVRRRR